jgi:hypothetical protein
VVHGRHSDLVSYKLLNNHALPNSKQIVHTSALWTAEHPAAAAFPLTRPVHQLVIVGKKNIVMPLQAQPLLSSAFTIYPQEPMEF